MAELPGADLIREQKIVVVDGVRELWRLQWQEPPVPTCGPQDVATALACGCGGFAYGEAGRLSLLRLRGGVVRERLELTPFFHHDAVPGSGQDAVLQRWRAITPSAHDEDDDWHHGSDLNFLQRVRARGPADVMRIADYNHDGQASEFLLQVATRGCGLPVMVLVGVSRYNRHLHVFASEDAPDTPLELVASSWEAVRAAGGTVRVVEQACGDPATTMEAAVRVTVRHGFFGIGREYRACAPPAEANAPY